MNNKAKCRLCSKIVESFHATDYVMCDCGEIYVDGGLALRCGAKDWKNFIRIDDEGNEIVPVIKHNDSPDVSDENVGKSNKKETLETLKEMIKVLQGLPNHAKEVPITHYDYEWLLKLLVSMWEQDPIDS